MKHLESLNAPEQNNTKIINFLKMFYCIIICTFEVISVMEYIKLLIK